MNYVVDFIRHESEVQISDTVNLSISDTVLLKYILHSFYSDLSLSESIYQKWTACRQYIPVDESDGFLILSLHYCYND